MKEIEDIEAAQEDANKLLDLNEYLTDTLTKALTPIKSTGPKFIHKSKLDVELEEILEDLNRCNA